MRSQSAFHNNTLLQALFFKKRGEEAVERSGMDYTIVRPGRVLQQLPAGQSQPGHILVSAPSPFSLPPFLSSAAILKSQVGMSNIILGGRVNEQDCAMEGKKHIQEAAVCNKQVSDENVAILHCTCHRKTGQHNLSTPLPTND